MLRAGRWGETQTGVLLLLFSILLSRSEVWLLTKVKEKNPFRHRESGSEQQPSKLKFILQIQINPHTIITERKMTIGLDSIVSYLFFVGADYYHGFNLLQRNSFLPFLHTIWRQWTKGTLTLCCYYSMIHFFQFLLLLWCCCPNVVTSGLLWSSLFFRTRISHWTNF